MHNRRGRMPNGMNQQQISTLGFGIVIIVIAFVIYQVFIKNGYYSQSSSIATTSLINQPRNFQTSEGNANNYNNYPLQSSSNLYDSSTYNSMDYSGQSSLPTSAKNDTLIGYWIIFDSNGVITQLNLGANDYAFIQRLIQNDNKGVPKIKIFLVENGRTQQFIVSNELYTIITNLNFIIDSRSVNNPMNSSTYGNPNTTPNMTPNANSNSSTSNPYPNSSNSSSYPNSSSSSSYPNSSNSNSTYNQSIKP